jgi:hypothetical protein
MGNLCGGEASQQTAADRQITRELHEAHRQLAEEVKLLLLGKLILSLAYHKKIGF